MGRKEGWKEEMEKKLRIGRIKRIILEIRG